MAAAGEEGEVHDDPVHPAVAALEWDRVAPGCGAEGKGRGDAATLWLGTKGAHSALHYDTYGANVVLQVAGAKRWRLWRPSCAPSPASASSLSSSSSTSSSHSPPVFSASSRMRPTRVPYEESSVFSEWDVRAPPPATTTDGGDDGSRQEQLPPPPDFEATLFAGDALFVPWQWWHDVECVSDEPALSANVWLDHHRRSSSSRKNSQREGSRKRARREEEEEEEEEEDGSKSEEEKEEEGLECDDSVERVSEAIVRVVASALIERGAREEGDGPANNGDGGAGAYERWVNPTEAIAPHADNMHMLRASLATVTAATGRSGAAAASSSRSSSSSGGGSSVVDEADLIAALLEPAAVRAATVRLLKRQHTGSRA